MGRRYYYGFIILLLGVVSVAYILALREEEGGIACASVRTGNMVQIFAMDTRVKDKVYGEIFAVDLETKESFFWQRTIRGKIKSSGMIEIPRIVFRCEKELKDLEEALIEKHSI